MIMKILKYICLMGLIGIKFISSTSTRQGYKLPGGNTDTMSMDQHTPQKSNGDKNQKGISPGLKFIFVGGSIVIIGAGGYFFTSKKDGYRESDLEDLKLQEENNKKQEENNKKQRLQEIEEGLKKLDDDNLQKQEEKKKNKIINIERARKNHYDKTFKIGLDPILKQILGMDDFINTNQFAGAFFTEVFNLLDGLQKDMIDESDDLTLDNDKKFKLLSTLQFFSFFKEKEGLLSTLKQNLSVKDNEELFKKLMDYSSLSEIQMKKLKSVIKVFDTKIKLDETNELNKAFNDKLGSETSLAKYKTEEISIKDILNQYFSELIGEKGYFYYYSELTINQNVFGFQNDKITNNRNTPNDESEIFEKYIEETQVFQYDMDFMKNRLDVLLDIVSKQENRDKLKKIADYLDTKIDSNNSILINYLSFDIKNKAWSRGSLTETMDLFQFKPGYSKIIKNIEELEEKYKLTSQNLNLRKSLYLYQVFETIQKTAKEGYATQCKKLQEEENKKAEENKRELEDQKNRFSTQNRFSTDENQSSTFKQGSKNNDK